VSDPRYPSAFQRPGSSSAPVGDPAAELRSPPASTGTAASPAPAPETPPAPTRRPRASARAATASERAPVERGGNRIVLLDGVEGETAETPPSQRNLALVGLYGLAGALLGRRGSCAAPSSGATAWA
jgi:hypothetical protein